jgi:hypothetical protein
MAKRTGWLVAADAFGFLAEAAALSQFKHQRCIGVIIAHHFGRQVVTEKPPLRLLPKMPVVSPK